METTGGELLDNVVSDQPTDVNRGNAVLGQIFGSKDVSRTVATSASAKTGSPQAGAGAGGGLGGILGSLLGGR